MISQKVRSIDLVYTSSIVLLSCLGLLVLYGFGVDVADSWFSTIFVKQCIYTAFGLVLFFVFMHIDYRYFKSLGTFFYFCSIALLILVLLTGDVVRGTVGWIQIGSFQFQPVELIKIALIIFMASFISKKKTQLQEKTRIITSLILVVLVVVLVLMQPDFGSAMILMGIWLGMMLFSGMQKRYIFSLVIVGSLIVVSGWFFLEDYQKLRIVNVLNPQLDAQGSGYNVIQSMVAAGSGGLTGKGIGQGSQSQLNFLPEKHTDFIFAAITENLGLVGAMFVLVLYGVVLYRIKKISLAAQDNFAYMVALGVFVMLFVQIVINIGMNIGLMPVTGIPLPFLSYGGSSLVSIYILSGILMNVYRRSGESHRITRNSAEILS